MTPQTGTTAELRMDIVKILKILQADTAEVRKINAVVLQALVHQAFAEHQIKMLLVSISELPRSHASKQMDFAKIFQIILLVYAGPTIIFVTIHQIVLITNNAVQAKLILRALISAPNIHFI